MGLLIGLIGATSAATGALIVGFMNWKAQSQQRKADFVEKQIRLLYGPVYFFCNQNENIFKLQHKYEQAIDKVYKIDTVPPDVMPPKAFSKLVTDSEEFNKVLEVKNEYIEDYVEKNNQKIIQVLSENWGLIDSEDIEDFSLFQIDQIRLKVERDENGKLKIPQKLYREIGDIFYARGDVFVKVQNKFIKKRSELEKLLSR